MEALAARAHAPAGATAAAWTLACAAALVEMGARAGSADRGRPRAIADRASSLRHEALRLGDADLDAAEQVIRRSAVTAHATASEVPKAVVVHATEIVGLALEVQQEVGRHLAADMKAAAALAAGACSAAAAIVAANLGGIDEKTCEAAARLASYARSECARLE